MPEPEAIAVVVLVVFAARMLETTVGFGGTLYALPVLALLTPALDMRSMALPTLTLGSIVCRLGMVWVGRKHLQWPQLGKVVAWMLVGMPAGFLLAGYVSESLLRLILGGFVATVALANLIPRHRAGVGDNPADGLLMRLYLRVVIVAAGVIHGIFTTGGPLLVVYGGHALRNKGLFRVTLAMVFLLLNAIMVLGWMAAGRIAPQAWLLAAITVPFVVAAVAAGDCCHHRLDESTFRKVAYLVLLLTGASLLYQAVPELLSSAVAYRPPGLG